MNSIGILSAVLFALFATTSALECRPVMCMIACPFGFALDAQGCPHCSCRTTPNVCRDPIFGHNCGSGIDHRSCPASHECQLHFGGFTGQCCLKPVASSTTAQPSTTATTARPTTSSTARATTRRALSRLLVVRDDASTPSPSTTGQATTPSGTTSGQSTTSGSRFFF